MIVYLLGTDVKKPYQHARRMTAYHEHPLSECRATVAKNSPTCMGMGLQAAALSLVNSDMVDIQVCLGINFVFVCNSFARLKIISGLPPTCF